MAACKSATGNCINALACNQNDGCMYEAKHPTPPKKILHGIEFNQETRADLIAALWSLYWSKVRVAIYYGDPKTGILFEPTRPLRGTIGGTTGNPKLMLLVKTTRSLGGEALLDGSILLIRESPSGKRIWSHPNLK